MALAITCSKINQTADGHVHVTFSDGLELEFPNKADAITWGKSADVRSAEALDVLRRLLMSWWLKGDPTAATPATVVGKTITADLTLPGIVTVA